MDKTSRSSSSVRTEKEDPIVSVIVPVYKGAHYLKTRSLPSILGQTYKSFECIIVDDGSPDNTREVAEEFIARDSRVKYFRKPNGGPSSARNFGVKKSSGSFIAFLDQDDEYAREYLETAINVFLGLPEKVGALTCGCIYIDDKDKRTYSLQVLDPFWQLAIGSGWVFRRSCFFDFNIWYDESIMNYEDVDITLHLSGYCKFHIIDKPLRLRYLYLGSDPGSPQSASGASPRLVPFFERFFQKNLSIYKQAGNEALAWLYHSGGLMYCQVGKMNKGREMLWRSFRIHKDFIVLANLFAAFLGAKGYRLVYHAKNRFMRYLRSKLLNPAPNQNK